jgi:hypothetical protein
VADRTANELAAQPAAGAVASDEVIRRSRTIQNSETRNQNAEVIEEGSSGLVVQCQEGNQEIESYRRKRDRVFGLGSAFEPKLDGVLANSTTERILMHLMHFGSVYGRQVSRGGRGSLAAVQDQLRNLEQCGVVRSRRVGKTAAFTFDDRYPYAEPLRDLVRAAYEAMSPAERAATFGE